MKTILAGAAIAAMAVGFSGAASAQSAKFTAAWEDGSVTLANFNTVGPVGETFATEVMATIKVPNKKELLIGVSGVANIVTFTQAKGKNGGGTSTAIAAAGMGLEVRVVPTTVDANCGDVVPEGGMIAAPGELTFASRHQELSVTVDLDIIEPTIADCVADGTPAEQAACIADLLEIDGSVTVALGLDTTAAHHFNFVAPDLGQGTYDVVACFEGSGLVSVNDAENLANSYAAIMQRMLTVQEVRAVQSDFIVVPD